MGAIARGAATRPPAETGRAPASLQGTGALAALVALGGAALCFVTGESLPVGLLPQLSSGLGVSLSTAGLLVTIYAVVVITVSAPLTRLTRGIPRRPLLAGLLGTFALATLAAAAAPSYAWLVAARVVIALAQAIFWSIVAVVAVGLVPAAVPGAGGRAGLCRQLDRPDPGHPGRDLARSAGGLAARLRGRRRPRSGRPRRPGRPPALDRIGARRTRPRGRTRMPAATG